ncbi:MAG: hypothetical protein MK438_05385, partial [SAR324 cluster bacterium]|nr:hypothetical protein [SAR324 cluster bacterium]
MERFDLYESVHEFNNLSSLKKIFKMKKYILLMFSFLTPLLVFSQEKGLDQKIDEAFKPISNFFQSIVFFEVAGSPFVIFLLVGSEL